MALQGLFLFTFNFWLIYLAEAHLTSGLVSLVFSTVIFMNMINGALLLRMPVQLRVLLGAMLGLVGVGLVFWPEVSSFSLSDASFYGLLLSIVSAFSASLGNIVSARNQKHGLPVIQTNAYGMAYGAALMHVLAIASGKPYSFDTSLVYIGSLLYLILFGSIIAFWCYLTLVGRIGANRAAYAMFLFPLVALGLSTLFEGFQWTGYAIFGVALVLAGNALVLSRRGKAT
jgi:drug/metabolite transporter (DMT)-like permease